MSTVYWPMVHDVVPHEEDRVLIKKVRRWQLTSIRASFVSEKKYFANVRDVLLNGALVE